MLFHALDSVFSRSDSAHVPEVTGHEIRVASPHFHNISHNILAVAKKFGVSVIFKTCFSLDALCPFQKCDKGCKSHRNSYVHFSLMWLIRCLLLVVLATPAK